MLGVISGFVALAKESVPSLTSVHCAIHCQAVETKTLSLCQSGAVYLRLLALTIYS